MPTTCNGKVLFVFPPEIGHISPTIVVAKQLQELAYCPVYLTSGHLGRYLVHKGFLTETYSGRHDPLPLPSTLYAIEEHGRGIWKKELGANGKRPPVRLLERVEEVTSKYNPRLIVFDRFFLPFLRPGLEKIATRWPIALLSTAMLQDVDVGCPLQWLDLVLCPEILQQASTRNRFPLAKFANLSVDIHRDEVTFPFDRLTADKRLIVCTFGTRSCHQTEILERFRVIKQVALRRKDLQFVMAVLDQSFERENEGSMPDNLICQAYLPQFALLENASLFITHAGLGSVKEALYAGVPMLAWPLSNDQFNNADRICALGIGVKLRESLSVEDLLKHLRNALESQSFTASIHELRSRLLSMENTSTAASMLDEVIKGESGRTSQRQR